MIHPLGLFRHHLQELVTHLVVVDRPPIDEGFQAGLDGGQGAAEAGPLTVPGQAQSRRMKSSASTVGVRDGTHSMPSAPR